MTMAGDEESTMVLPPARTLDEAYLHLDLTPCPTCGSIETEWQRALAQVDGELVAAYEGTCQGCSAAREYLFQLPAREHAGGTPNFGGPEPSALLDPGQWLEVADQVMAAVPTDDPRAAGEMASFAAAAVAEVLKFVPAEADAVPAERFWSAAGRQAYERQPGRFHRDRLQVVLDSYSGVS
jgi:hypothetical protein